MVLALLRKQLSLSAAATCTAAASVAIWFVVSQVLAVVRTAAQGSAIPLSDSTLVAMVCTMWVGVMDSLIVRLMASHKRTNLPALAVVAVVIWAIVCAIGWAVGAEDLGPNALWTLAFIHTFNAPIVLLVRRGVTRRALSRCVLLVAIKSSAAIAGVLGVFYVSITTKASLSEATQIFVFGCLYPTVQATVMYFSASRSATAESTLNRRKPATCPSELDEKGPGSALDVEGASAAAVVAEVAAPPSGRAQRRSRKQQSGTSAAAQTFFPMVLVLEMIFSVCGFTTLLLAEEEETFYTSLSVMLLVEVSQIVAYVKMRAAIARVADENIAEAVVGSNRMLAEWVTYREQGEKCGVVVACAFLVVQRVRPTIGGLSFSNVTPHALVVRSSVTIVAEMLADIVKDLVSDFIGVQEMTAVRVEQTRLTVLNNICGGLVALTAAQLGLSLKFNFA